MRVVINLDAIGNAGPAALFETGPGNGQVVRAIARGVRSPVGGSFAEAVYGAMPNDTDYSVFRDRGVPGANIALGGNGRAYHSAFDTPERLSPSGLQHLGEVTLDVLLELGELDLASAAAEERHFIVLPAGIVVHWATGWTRGLVGFAAALALAAGVASWRRARRSSDVGARHALGAAAFAGLASTIAACVAGCVTAGALIALGGWSPSAPPSPGAAFGAPAASVPTTAGEVAVRLILAVGAASLAHFGLFAWAGRSSFGARCLAVVPALSAAAWLTVVLVIGSALGDAAQPLVALAALPVCLAVLLDAVVERRPSATSSSSAEDQPRAPLRFTYVGSALSAAIVASSVQSVHQVSSVAPWIEAAFVAATVSLGLVLLAPWPAAAASRDTGAARAATIAGDEVLSAPRPRRRAAPRGGRIARSEDPREAPRRDG